MTSTNQPTIRPEVQKALGRLRRKIRRYVFFRGVLVLLAWLGLVFWASLALDWLPVALGHDEPGHQTRVFLLGLYALLTLGVTFWWLLRRLFVRLPDRAMAVLLERRFQEFHDSLITTVELGQEPEHAQAFDTRLLEHTFQEAAQQVRQVPLSQVFRLRPLVQAGVLAAAAVLSVGAFAAAAPEAFHIWFRRTLLLQDLRWPRRHHIEVEGPRVRKVARGDDVTVLVRADAAKRIPRTVRLEYQFADGTWGEENMTREGVPEQGYQLFSYTFRDLAQSVRFDAVGGDHRVRDYVIQVVDSPTAELALHCVFPQYMVDPEHGLYTPRTLPVTGVMELPQGTQITVLARTNKPLQKAWARLPADKEDQGEREVSLELTGPRSFQLRIDSLDRDMVIQFRLLDRDGIENKRPIRLALVAVPDQPPEVDIRLLGIGTAVTPDVRIPLAGKIRDDYGVARVWWSYRLDEAPEVKVPLAADAKHRTEILWDEDDSPVLDFRQLRLQALERLRQSRKDSEEKQPPEEDEKALAPYRLVPGQKLVLTVVASDACTLSGGPNSAQGQRYLLDVVTAEELRAILAAQELNLRRRLEQILEEVRETQDSLLRVQFAPREGEGARNDPLEVAALRVQRARQNSEKNRNEVLGVSVGFDDIRRQFINNRMYNKEIDERIRGRIAAPLRQVAEEMYPELDRLLAQLQENLARPEKRNQLLEKSQKQLAEIILRLENVLQNMLELESFEEAIQLIQEIIQEQKQLTEKTKKYRIRRLLNP